MKEFLTKNGLTTADAVTGLKEMGLFLLGIAIFAGAMALWG